MAKTEFGVNHPLAVKVWSKKLMTEAIANTWIGKFIGNSKDSLIYRKDEVSKNAGDQVVCGLRMRLAGEGVQGDATLEGQEEALTTYSDTLVINQLRHATRSAGKMSEQRVPFDVRQDNLEGLRDWWAERFDQSFANQVAAFTAQTDTRFTGNNAAVAADTDHLIRAGGVANDESLTSGNKFDLSLIDACVARAKTYFENGIPIIRPLRVDGEDKYVMFLHPYQVRDMRTNASNGQWLDIQKAATAGGERNKSPIFTGALGEYNGVVLHEWTRLPKGVHSSSNAAAGRDPNAVIYEYAVRHGYRPRPSRNDVRRPASAPVRRPMIGAILVQTGTVFWWASSINERISVLETWHQDSKGIAADIAVVRSQVADLKTALNRIESRLVKD